MKMVDHARLVQALQETSVLVSSHLDPQKHGVATQSLQHSIALLLGELNKDWCDLVPQTGAEPSVGVPD